jgi:superfamily II DNA or RNA helicase
MSKRNEVQQEALQIALNTNRCGLGISMGVGKTLIGLRYLSTLSLQNDDFKALVVAPKLSIFESWKNDAEKFGIPEIMEKVTFTTYLSMTKVNPHDYNVLVLDECHSLLFSHELWLNAYSGRILGLTGTPPKMQQTEKGQMVSKFCPITYTYIVKDAVDDQILNDYQIIVHMLPLSTARNVAVNKKNGGVFYTSEFNQYEYWCDRVDQAKTPKEKQIASIMRMRAMMEFPSKERYTRRLLGESTEQCIVFANTIEQARKVCTYTYDSRNPDSEENLQAFGNGNIKNMACVLQLSEGISIPNLKEGIIMHAYGNERKSAQRIGRLLRLNPTETATAHVLCYTGTVDEKWVKTALEDFDQNKITYQTMMYESNFH